MNDKWRRIISMEKNYFRYFPVISIGFLFLLVTSCKKNNPAPTPAVADPVNYAKLGLYEQVSGTTRRVFVAVSQVGTQSFSTPYGLVFDTGSTGLTIDASGLLPASMITSSGLVIAGDSTTVNGITVTTQQTTISYGGVDGQITEYGNLAYAPVTIGDANGNITTPRIPIFIYYKIMNTTTNTQLPTHSADIFGVGPGVSYTSRSIASPLSYFKLPANVANGFRLAQLSTASFNATATYVPNLLYIGLTPNDLNNSNFIMHPLTYSSVSGYSPNITSTITYGGISFPGIVLFDTGTPAISILENPNATANMATLPANTTVSVTTGQGFSYQYTTSANYNLTEVENPSYSRDSRTIFSIDFFLSNEYLLDYANHRIGLKNN
jgi:hypothetical protein